MPELFDKHGGFRRLHSFTLATIVQLETLRFCRRFITQDPRDSGAKFCDPKGRQYDQMTQAARSGRQNIIEGSERSATSKDTEMKLTDVARAHRQTPRGAQPGHRARARLPAVRQAHAQAAVGQGRFLGLLRLSRLPRHPAGTRAGTAVTPSSMRSVRSIPDSKATRTWGTLLFDRTPLNSRESDVLSQRHLRGHRRVCVRARFPRAERRPSALHATATTPAVWPLSTRRHRPRSTSHNRTLWSSEPERASH